MNEPVTVVRHGEPSAKIPIALPDGFRFLGQACRTNTDIAHILMRTFCGGVSWVRFIVIDGDPESKQRPRLGKSGRFYSPSAKTESALRWRLRQSFSERISGNLAVACVFFRSSKQRIDADNMMKHVMDAATGVCWHDDSQVTAQAGFIELDPDHPRTIIVMGPHESSMARDGVLLLEREFVCSGCGKSFRTKQSGTHKYCSRKCSAETRTYLKEDVKCGWCAKEFRRKVAAQKFCSNECRLDSLFAGTRAKRPPKPNCRICGKQLSRHGYALCRACWSTAR